MNTLSNAYDYLYHHRQSSDKLLVLLHGTGGSERDLITLADHIAPEMSVLSLRGDVLENGARRFFKRHAEGQYDLNDLAQRGQKLARFLENFGDVHGYAPKQMILLGFSNGANIALHVVMQRELAILAGAFLAPLYPLSPADSLDLTDFSAFVSMGQRDPIVPVAESQRVPAMLSDAGADLTEYWVENHEITGDLVEALREWFEDLKEEPS